MKLHREDFVVFTPTDTVVNLRVGERLVNDEMFTVRQASERTTWCRTKLYDMMNNGQLAFIRVGRSRRIPRSALADLLARGFVPACPKVR
jgi:excisionase family DNA binding protein